MLTTTTRQPLLLLHGLSFNRALAGKTTKLLHQNGQAGRSVAVIIVNLTGLGGKSILRAPLGVPRRPLKIPQLCAIVLHVYVLSRDAASERSLLPRASSGEPEEFRLGLLSRFHIFDRG